MCAKIYLELFMQKATPQREGRKHRKANENKTEGYGDVENLIQLTDKQTDWLPGRYIVITEADILDSIYAYPNQFQ